MSGPVWLWLALALVLLPTAPQARVRAASLAAHGRLRRIDPAPAGPGRRPTSSLLWWLLGSCAAGAVVGAEQLAGVAVALAVLIVVGCAARLARSARIRRRREQREAQVLAAVRLLAAELEAGAPAAAALATATDQLAEHAPDLAARWRAEAHDLASGAPRTDAGDPVGADELAGLVPAWRLATVTGAPLAEVCGRVAADLAARIDQRRSVATALAGARSSAALLAVLPVLGVLLGTAMQARPVHVLFGTPTGHGLVLAGVALEAAGLLWTHWLAARAEGP